MASKLIHLHNATAGALPLIADLLPGRIAINHADGKIYISNATGDGVLTFSAGAGVGDVKSVNSKTPDGTGNVTLVPSDLGATTVGTAVFTAATTTAAQTAIGATATGQSLITAANAAAVRTAAGITAIGSSIVTAADAPSARTALGSTTVGDAVFTAASTGAAQTALGATTTGAALFTAASVAAAQTTLGAGAANGLATLDGNSKVPTAQLPDAILGSVNYQGSFDATSGSVPAAATANKGWYYVVSVAGTYTPPGQSALTLKLGDWLISNGTVWQTVNAQDAVSSVAGKTGAVVLAAADIASGTFVAARLGSGSGNNKVLTTDGSGNPAFVDTVPTLNLPTATTSALGLAQAGTGLTATAGVFAVDTTVLTMDEGSYTAA